MFLSLISKAFTSGKLLTSWSFYLYRSWHVEMWSAVKCTKENTSTNTKLSYDSLSLLFWCKQASDVIISSGDELAMCDFQHSICFSICLNKNITTWVSRLCVCNWNDKYLFVILSHRWSLTKIHYELCSTGLELLWAHHNISFSTFKYRYTKTCREGSKEKREVRREKGVRKMVLPFWLKYLCRNGRCHIADAKVYF